jgi:uncharacterized protein (DUF362 family)/ferredoxin
MSIDSVVRKVAFASCQDYSQGTLRAALEDIVSVQVAENGPLSGKAFVLKPNWLAWRRRDDIACVNPAVVVELCRIFKDAGAAKVAIMENPAVQTAPSIAKAMGIDLELARLGVEVFNFSDYRRIEAVPGVKFRNIELATEHLPFDAMVNVAKAKTHAMMTLTLCVKNLFGMVKGSERMGWHLAVGKDFGAFADMLLDIYLNVKPSFNILDAVVCMEGNGPGSGEPAHRGFLAGSSDALALDAAVSPLFGVDAMPVLDKASERGLIPSFELCGAIPIRKPLELPPPPGLLVEWGMPLPPVLKTLFRDSVVSRPLLDAKRCTGCGLCAKMCPPQSLKMHSGKPVFDLPNCIRCYCCQEHCPNGAITSKKTLAMKVAELFEDSVRSLFGKKSARMK